MPEYVPDPEPITAADAAAMMSGPPEAEKPEPAPEPDAPDDETPPADEADDDAAPQDETSGETDPDEGEEPEGEDDDTDSEDEDGEPDDDDETAEEPAIDPPASWTRPEKEAFKLLPREYQQTIANREAERTSSLRRTQNEAAEIRKQAEEMLTQAQQKEKFYQEQIPAVQAALNAQRAELVNRFQAEFADIQSEADLDALRTYDTPRFLKFQESVAKVQAIDNQQRSHAERQQQYQAQLDAERQANIEKFKAEEAAKFVEAAPEYADPQVVPKLYEQVRSYFDDIGIAEDELTNLFSGDGTFSVHDHRAQLIIRDAARYRAAEKAARAPKPKSAPKMQRPGTSSTKGERRSSHLETLDKRLSSSGSRDDAVALLRATGRG